MSSKNISKPFGVVPDVKSTEKLRHEHEVETTTSFVMYYSYGVGEGKSKVRGAPQMNSRGNVTSKVQRFRGYGETKNFLL